MDTKSTTIIGGVVFLIIAIGLVLWYMGEHPAPFNNQHGGTGMATSTTAAVGDQKLDEHAKYYDITASYPGSVALGAGSSAQAVEIMKQFEVNAISAFKEQGNFDKLTPQDIKMFGFDQGRKEALEIKYNTNKGPHSVSYVFTLYEDTFGAHPNTYYRTFTFDTKTGKGVDLSDIFSSTDYLTTLSNMSRAQLPSVIAKKGGMKVSEVDTDYIQRGTTPDTDNFTNWYIEKGNLVLIFPPYQVGPYVIGEQEVSLPLSSLPGVSATFK